MGTGIAPLKACFRSNSQQTPGKSEGCQRLCTYRTKSCLEHVKASVWKTSPFQSVCSSFALIHASMHLAKIVYNFSSVNHERLQVPSEFLLSCISCLQSNYPVKRKYYFYYHHYYTNKLVLTTSKQVFQHFVLYAYTYLVE